MASKRVAWRFRPWILFLKTVVKVLSGLFVVVFGKSPKNMAKWVMVLRTSRVLALLKAFPWDFWLRKEGGSGLHGGFVGKNPGSSGPFG